jgi:ribonuclease HII
MKNDLWAFEKTAWEKGFTKIAGTDEAGRGPLAGPVVAASVILPASFAVAGINDSKKISAGNRARYYHKIYDQAVSVGIGIVDAAQIDRINILQAALLAMALAVENLIPRPDFVFVDGTFPIPSDMVQEPIPKGDGRSISVAAASIVAKVTRDRLMEGYHQQYPQYGFVRHKGYPTKAHKAAIQHFGPCPIHRRSFKGVKEYI